MAFWAYFYAWDKKPNSTSVPSQNVQYQGEFNLKDDSSLESPIIEVTFADDDYIALLNMVYIPIFKRYYFIRDTHYYRGVWTFHLISDVLASFRSQILGSEKYVLRSASEADVSITDTLYPTTAVTSVSESTENCPWCSIAPTGGCFVVGIINDNTNGYGCITYYVLTYSQMNILMSKVFNTTFINGIKDISEELAKAIFNPSQYISSCIWLPFWPDTDTKSLKIGWVDGGGNIASLRTPTTYYSGGFTIGKHPQAKSLDSYLQASPFTHLTLDLPGIGVIPIDPMKCRSNSISWEVRIDAVTGIAEARIAGSGSIDSGGSLDIIAVASGRVGVPMATGQTSGNGGGIVGSLFNAVGGGVSALTMSAGQIGSKGNPLSVSAGVIGSASMVGSGIAASFVETFPQARSSGAQGSFASTGYTRSIRFSRKYTYTSGKGPTENGQPLMKMRTLSTLSGFTQVSEGSVKCWALAGEHERIKAYLEGGFFIE